MNIKNQNKISPTIHRKNKLSNSTLIVKKSKNIIFITLNRPEKRNALNPQIICSLSDIFKSIERDPNVRAVVLSGNGKAFCSGADLKWLTNEKAFSKKSLNQLFTLLEQIDTCKVPVIAKVHGFIMGGGIGLISVCDMVIAELSSCFQFSETRLGLVPSMISPFILKKIPVSWARFFMLSALSFSAKEAQHAGLVHFIGNTKKCDAFLQTLLEHLKQLDITAVKKTKEILHKAYLCPIQKIKSQAVNTIHTARKAKTTQARIKKLLTPSKGE